MYSELMCALGNCGVGSSAMIGSFLMGTLVPESPAANGWAPRGGGGGAPGRPWALALSGSPDSAAS